MQIPPLVFPSSGIKARLEIRGEILKKRQKKKSRGKLGKRAFCVRVCMTLADRPSDRGKDCACLCDVRIAITLSLGREGQKECKAS